MTQSSRLIFKRLEHYPEGNNGRTTDEYTVDQTDTLWYWGIFPRPYTC
jgi:hypothetical protein